MTEPDYHRLVAFGKLVELCNQFIRTGREVFAEGRLHSHSWNDNQGVQKAVTKIILDDVVLLDSKPQPEASSEPAAQADNQRAATIS